MFLLTYFSCDLMGYSSMSSDCCLFKLAWLQGLAIDVSSSFFVFLGQLMACSIVARLSVSVCYVELHGTCPHTHACHFTDHITSFHSSFCSESWYLPLWVSVWCMSVVSYLMHNMTFKKQKRQTIKTKLSKQNIIRWPFPLLDRSFTLELASQ